MARRLTMASAQMGLISRPTRNYKCVQAIKQGRHKEGSGAICASRNIPRPVIEKVVVDALLDQLRQR